MKISKGLITAAGEPHRRLPLQTLVDSDGVPRTVLAMLVSEVLGSGIEQVLVIVPPGEEEMYARATEGFGDSLHFARQEGPPGYAQAILCGRRFLGDEPFLHLVSDHVYVRGTEGNVARRAVDLASEENCCVSAVQSTHESGIGRFGVVGGRPLAGRHFVYEVDTVIEKPTPTIAEERLAVAGLRAGYYLAFFGIHVFTPEFLEALERRTTGDARDSSGAVSEALAEIAKQSRYLALQTDGRRYDLGPKYGLLRSQLALTLDGPDREELLANFVELLSASPVFRGRTNGE
ncbi:MAG: UTP--glucose-1-phosphate uridylyltransferase [Bryobacterales bacterium]|nr:UTP--glucose-1-phosphate uridylyltransferase [Bryobacterales bacterium]